MALKGIDDALAAGAEITRTPVTCREEVGRAYGAPPPDAEPPTAPPDLPGDEHGGVENGRVHVNAIENQMEVARQMRNILPRCNELYVMNRRVYIEQRDEAGSRPVGLIPVDPDQLGTVVNDHIRFYRDGEDGPLPVQPPKMALKCLLSVGPWPGVRVVSRIAAAPTLTPDGRLLAQPGYDAGSGILYVGDPHDLRVPAAPTREDARREASGLLELAIDFPFLGLADAATWLALLLTAVGRALIDGPTPLFAITANIRGAGKTRLVDIAHIILTGRAVPVAPVPKEQEELRKQVTAELLTGAPIGLLDNLDAPLRGAVIEALLTSTVFRGRRLQHTEILVLPNLCTWCATGNGLRVAGDAARRAVWVRLDSPRARPELRTDYRVPDLMDLVRRHRLRLLLAAASILAAYLRAGRPNAGARPLGSFESWGRLVQNVLVWLGLPDPGECQAEGGQAEEGEDELRRLVYAVWRLQHPRGVLVRDLLLAADAARRRTGGDDPQPAATALYEAVEMSDVNSPRALGRLLGTLVDRQFEVGEYRFTLTQAKTVQRAVVWKVVVTDRAGATLADGELPDDLDPPATGRSVSLVSSVSHNCRFESQLREWQHQYGLSAGLAEFLGVNSPNSLDSPDPANGLPGQQVTPSEPAETKLTPQPANSLTSQASGQPAGPEPLPNGGLQAPEGRGEARGSEFGELDAGLIEADSLARPDPDPDDSPVELPDGCRQVAPGVWEV